MTSTTRPSSSHKWSTQQTKLTQRYSTRGSRERCAGVSGAVRVTQSGATSGRRPPPAPRSSPPRPRPARRGARQAADDVPVFDRNKVSLDFPGSLFGPSVSLLIKTTKIVGDVIQNSAVRYQSFLRLFRPLFRGQFEIKGLDPPTTTTTTPAPPTTTPTTPTKTPATPAVASNEVRRRRRVSTRTN